MPMLFSRSRIFFAVRLLWTALALFFAAVMIARPEVVLAGARSGLNVWWNIVFPSLLPFLVTSELLLSFGVVHFLSELLEPVMRPIFNVPGAGSFAMAVGYTSGYPIGAMITAKLRQEGLCTRFEGERLMCFTNNSSPLFMLVAVAVGMLGKPELGLIIAGAHYMANLTLGFFLRFYGIKDHERNTSYQNSVPLFRRSLQALMAKQRQEKRPFAQILGDAVKNSIRTLLTIGGFIILFAVIIKLLESYGFISIFTRWLVYLLSPLSLPPTLLKALASGFFEITTGCKIASETLSATTQKLVVIAIILGWSGLCVHAQVASMIAETDLRMSVFVFSRIAQACLAAFYTFLFLRSGHLFSVSTTIPVLSFLHDNMVHIPLTTILFYTLLEFGILLAFLLAGLLYALASCVRIIAWRFHTR